MAKSKTKPASTDRPAADPPTTVLIELPLAEPPLDGYVSRDLHVEVRAGERYQADALRRLLAGLHQKGAKLRSGRPVSSMADAVRWLAEGIDEQVAAVEDQ